MGRRPGVATIAVSMVVAAALLAACTASETTATSTSAAPSGGIRQVGGTATWAEAPNTRPNYIFPFMNLAYFTVANIYQFQYLMYRPLYWFGNNGQPTLNPSLSLAENPVYSNQDTTVSLRLKPYKWSNGEAVSAQDIMFWMNMMHSDKANWAGYVLNFIPDNIKNISVDSPTQLTFTLTTPVNPTWFTYDQLSQITPLPVAWDIAATGASAGSGGCSAAAFGTGDLKCNAVYTFLSKEAGDDPASPHTTNDALATYATNTLWQIVDGPWKLSSFDAAGNASFVLNERYSGSPRPTLSKFVEAPFTTESAEFDALTSGRLNFGYLPLNDVTKPTTDALVPAANNPHVSNFSLAPLYMWSIDYFPENFNSTGDGGNAGNIWKQLYFRQALEYLIDQPRLIGKIAKGYGVPTYGPVPGIPATRFLRATRIATRTPTACPRPGAC